MSEKNLRSNLIGYDSTSETVTITRGSNEGEVYSVNHTGYPVDRDGNLDGEASAAPGDSTTRTLNLSGFAEGT